jgi:hypothetical protein
MKEHNFSTEDRYVPENVMLLNISDNYDTYFFNENLRIYHINQDNHESLADKLADGWKITFPKGMRYAKLEDINRRSHKMVYKPILFLKTLVNYARFGLHGEINFLQTINDIKNSFIKFLIILLMPVAIILYIQDRSKLK